MTLADKLFIAFPDAKFSSVGDEIEWDKENSYSKPTEDEINAKFQASQYQRNRALAYDPIPEQLDQIYHDIDAWKAKIKAVKDKYPKP